MSGPIITLGYTGQTVTYTVPTTGYYYIVAFGAQGGTGGISAGGRGAEIGGEFMLSADEALTVAVGGVGGSARNGGGGGGGGSFVVGPSNAPLVIAGGGGGGGTGVVGSGQTGTSGSATPGGGAGGTSGTGGEGGSNDTYGDGGGGGGFLSRGSSSSDEGGGGGGGGGYPGLASGAAGSGTGVPAASAAGGFGGGGGSDHVGGGGGGGYSGGGGGGGFNGGGGGGSFDADTGHMLLVAGENRGNGSVLIALVDAPIISGTVANQATSSAATIDPFASVSISDPNLGSLPETITVTPSSTTNGTLSDPNAGNDGGTFSGGVYTVTGTAAQVQAALRGLVFTPASGLAARTAFTIIDTNVAGQAAIDAAASVLAFLPSTISGTQAGQAATDEATIKPFAVVRIADPNAGSPTETVTVTPGATVNGMLSDPNLAADGGSFNGGAYSISGTAAAVTAALDGLVFTPAAHEVAPGQTVTTGFTISDTNSAGQTSTDSTTTVIATAVNDPPVISGTRSGQSMAGTTPLAPFSAVTITDPDLGTQDSLAITLTGSGGTATDAAGTLAGTGLSKTGTGSYALAAASPATLSSELDSLVFIPAAGAPGTVTTTSFTLVAYQTAGGSTATATDSTTAVTDVVPFQASSITGTAANQPTADETAISPFAHVAITDPNLGSPTETVTVTPGTTANGALSDPHAATDGGTLNGGTYTVSGTAAAVTAALEGLVFTPAAHGAAPGQTVTTGFTITDTNSASLTATDTITSVITTAINDAPTISGTRAGQTSADEAKVNPFSGVSVTDADVAVQDSLIITLTSSGMATDADGTLSGTALSKTGTGTYTLAAASPATLTGELDALTFTPTAHQVTPGQAVTTGFTLTASQAAGGSTVTSIDSTATVVATAANDPPSISGTHATSITDEQTATPFSGVATTDPDAGVTDSVTITLTSGGVATAANGGFAPVSGLTSLGGGVYTLAAATPASLTSTLDALVFDPAVHEVAPGSTVVTGFTLSVNQAAGGSTVSTTDSTATLSATAVNDAPVITLTPPASAAITDQQTAAPLANVKVSDPDNQVGVIDTVTITETGAGAADALGKLSLAGTTGVTFSEGSSGSYTLTGSLSAVDAALLAVTFKPAQLVLGASQNGTVGFSLSAVQVSGTSRSATATATGPSLAVNGTAHNSTVVNLNGYFDGVGAPATAAPYTIAAGPMVNGAAYGGGTINGTGKSQTINAFGYFNTIVASGGNDTINAGLGDALVTVSDGNGAVTVSGSQGSSGVVLGNGNDTISLGGYFNIVQLGSGNDTVNAGLGGAIITLGGGNDGVTAQGYGNAITAGNGNDTVTGPQGLSAVTLGNGNDSVTLGGYSNVVTVGNGNDTIVAGLGLDKVTAGSGSDTVTLAGWTNIVSLGAGTDTVNAGSGDTIAINGTTLGLKGGTSEIVTVGGAGGSLTDQSSGTQVKIGTDSGSLSLTGIAADKGFVLDLLGGVGGYTSYAGLAKVFTSDGHGGTQLHLGTGASAATIDFINTPQTALTAAMFRFN